MKISQLTSVSSLDGTETTPCVQSGSTLKATYQLVANLFKGTKGADLASAATVNLGAATGNTVHITGTTTITAFDSVSAGIERTAIFDGALTLTHNATSLILPTGANITTAAGDTARFMSEGSGNWRCLSYMRKSGQSLAASVTIYDTWGIAVSDEATAITTGATKVTWYAPYACTIDEVFIGLSTQSTSGAVTADVNKAGVSIFSTNPSIDANEDTNLTGTAAVLSTTTLAKGDKLTIDIDAAGTGAKGLKVFFRVHY